MHGRTFDHAVENSRVLFRAAKAAGVRRVVHISITNPSAASPYEYFRGKALVEQVLNESGLSHAILRPAVIFGDRGILINNIAWALRHMPVFGLFGDGAYGLQPIFVGDLAELAIGLSRRDENATIDAIGPETFTYRSLVEAIAGAMKVRRPIVPMPPRTALALVWALSKLLGDQIVTREEMWAMMDGLLCTSSPAAGTTRLTDWLSIHGDQLGHKYMSETAHRR